MTRSPVPPRAALAALLLAAALAAGPAQAQIKLAVAAPITGPNAAFGAQLLNGARQAVEDINAAGGVLGQRLLLSTGDDVSDPRQGVSVANKLAGEGVRFVVGHFNSGVTIPASDVYQENGMLMITPAATNPRLTEAGKWNVFRTCGRDDQQAMTAGAYVLANFKGRNVAVVHDKTTYGKGLADETKKVVNAGGLQEVIYEGVNAGEKDFSALVTKLKSARVDLMYWGGLHTELGLIVRQLRDQGSPIVAMGADGIASDEYATVGGPGTEGTLMTFPPDPRLRPESKSVVEAFRAKGINPEAYTLYSYAAVQVIKQAIEKAGAADARKAADVLHAGAAFDTVIGGISYDKKGDRTRPDYVVYTWKKGADGKISYVQN